MALGLIAITGCVGYLAYMKTKYENMGYYVAVKDDGSQQLHPRKSRWDWSMAVAWCKYLDFQVCENELQ